MRNCLITVAIFLFSIFLLGVYLIGTAFLGFIWKHKLATIIVIFIAYVAITAVFPFDEDD